MKSHLHHLIKINGPLTISQFMNEALFHPRLGYYQQQNPFGRDGDFITAPEISQVFGELIAAYFINLWQNNYAGQKINLVEMGAGRGTLMKDFLNLAKNIPHFLANVNLSIVEISPKLQAVQQQNLSEFSINWYNNFVDFYQKNSAQPIFFIANELFDCFAIDQLVKTDHGWTQRIVDVGNNGELIFGLSPTIPTLLLNPAIHNTNAKTSDIYEYSSQAINFMDELSKAIKQTGGIGLIIDYGYIENQFKNTLQGIKSHQFCDVLLEVGNCDITALVDFHSLQNIATKNHLLTSLVTQKEFLTALGIEARREKLLAEKTPAEQDLINSSVDRLINEEQMGELFKVLVIW